MKTERRSVIKKMFASVVGLTGLGMAANAKAILRWKRKQIILPTFQDVPLFSGYTKFGNLVFIAGKGAHVAPFKIKAHTEIVLKELEKELLKLVPQWRKSLK